MSERQIAAVREDLRVRIAFAKRAAEDALKYDTKECVAYWDGAGNALKHFRRHFNRRLLRHK